MVKGSIKNKNFLNHVCVYTSVPTSLFESDAFIKEDSLYVCSTYFEAVRQQKHSERHVDSLLLLYVLACQHCCSIPMLLSRNILIMYTVYFEAVRQKHPEDTSTHFSPPSNIFMYSFIFFQRALRMSSSLRTGASISSSREAAATELLVDTDETSDSARVGDVERR